jgi:integrase
MKAGREHRIPLAPAALTVLDELATIRRDHLLLPGTVSGRPISGSELTKFMRTLRPGSTVHGWRATFRTWCSETNAARPDIAEAALAHAQRDQVVAAYQRGDLFDLRAGLMAQWAQFLANGAGR